MHSWFEDNLKLLGIRQPQEAELLALYPPEPTSDGFVFRLDQKQTISLSPGLSGPALSLETEDRSIKLTSTIAPQKEDIALVSRWLQKIDGTGVTVMGFGLGFHLEELILRLNDQSPIWLLEARPQLAAAAMTARDLSPVISYQGFKLFIGTHTRLPEGAPPNILERPVNRRLDNNLYPTANKQRGPLLKATGQKVLFFNTGYYLSREVVHAAKELGYDCSSWDPNPDNPDRDYKKLLIHIKEFRPSLILTINHLGFDTEGLLAGILGRLGLPAASWFVDSPLYILGNSPPNPHPDLSVFSWDSDYLEVLEKLGFTRRYHLPLGTDPEIFHPGEVTIKRPLAFVGDSMTKATKKYLSLAGLTEECLPELDQHAARFLEVPDLTPESIWEDLPEKLGVVLASERLALSALITWRASRLWRLTVLSALPSEDLTIAGDKSWSKTLPGYNLTGMVDYYRNLSSFYRDSVINLNITSAQMKTGLNQRIFDVPASGAFLLTDYRAQLEQVFEPQREVICYHNPEEARELATWYINHETERKAVIERARQRVLSSHLYRYRLAKLVQLALGGRTWS